MGWFQPTTRLYEAAIIDLKFQLEALDEKVDERRNLLAYFEACKKYDQEPDARALATAQEILTR